MITQTVRNALLRKALLVIAAALASSVGTFLAVAQPAVHAALCGLAQ